MAYSQGRRAVRAAAHRRRRGGRAAPARVPSGKVGNWATAQRLCGASALYSAPAPLIKMHSESSIMQGGCRQICECVRLDVDELERATAGEHRLFRSVGAWTPARSGGGRSFGVTGT